MDVIGVKFPKNVKQHVCINIYTKQQKYKEKTVEDITISGSCMSSQLLSTRNQRQECN